MKLTLTKTAFLFLLLTFLSVQAQQWRVIASGLRHSLAIKTDGTLWAWGGNEYGQLGNGTNTNKNCPTQIGSDNNWQNVSAGYDHSLAIKTDGTLWVWGYNRYWQLGDGTDVTRNRPTQIGTEKNWQTVSAGYNHSLAMKTDGTLWAWGINYQGQLGTRTGPQNTPIQIGTSNEWQTIAAGGYHSIAVGAAPAEPQKTKSGRSNLANVKTGDSTLWAWGYNKYGQLGDGTNIDKYAPVMVTECNTNSVENVLEKTIAQPYPNPTKALLHVPFSVTQTSKTKITLYNELAEKVVVLQENPSMLQGNYEIEYNAKDLPSGKYYCIIEIGTTKKILNFNVEK